MNNFMLVEVFVSTNDLFGYYQNFGFRKFFSCIQDVFERVFIAQFLKQINSIIISRSCLISRNKVWMFEGFHDFHLFLQRLNQCFGQITEINRYELHSNQVAVSDVSSLPNSSIETFPYLISQINDKGFLKSVVASLELCSFFFNKL